MYQQNMEANIEATFSFNENNNRITLSGQINLFNEQRSFRLEPCNTVGNEDCHLLMEVEHRERSEFFFFFLNNFMVDNG
jgi:hypothetical protein